MGCPTHLATASLCEAQRRSLLAGDEQKQTGNASVHVFVLFFVLSELGTKWVKGVGWRWVDVM